MKIYIATKFENIAPYRELKAKLVALGHHITHDWTNETVEGVPADKLNAYLKKCAEQAMDGAECCDVLILIWHPKMVGAHVEMGMAITAGARVIVIDEKGESKCIFNHLDDVILVKTFDEAISVLHK